MAERVGQGIASSRGAGVFDVACANVDQVYHLTSPHPLSKIIAHLFSIRMISHNISTALILESDADWDMRIKTIMPRLAEGIKVLVDWPFNRPHHVIDPRIEPYGDSWDVLWIGHCGSNHDGNIRMYSWNDTTVPPGSSFPFPLIYLR